jgi:hypothetical protein
MSYRITQFKCYQCTVYPAIEHHHSSTRLPGAAISRLRKAKTRGREARGGWRGDPKDHLIPPATTPSTPCKQCDSLRYFLLKKVAICTKIELPQTKLAVPDTRITERRNHTKNLRNLQSASPPHSERAPNTKSTTHQCTVYPAIKHQHASSRLPGAAIPRLRKAKTHGREARGGGEGTPRSSYTHSHHSINAL